MKKHATFEDWQKENPGFKAFWKANPTLSMADAMKAYHTKVRDAAPKLLEALKRVQNVAETASNILRSLDAEESQRFKQDAEFIQSVLRGLA